MNNTSPRNDPETFDFTDAIQKRIVAMLVADKDSFVANSEIVAPEMFENPVLRDMVALLHGFYIKYHKPADQDEFLQEFSTLLDNKKNIPVDEYFGVLEEVMMLVAEGSFDYARDKATEFARYQAMKNFFLDGADLLKKKRDYPEIDRRYTKAVGVGTRAPEDDRVLETICAADLVAEDMEWLWHNTVPKAKLSLLVGKPEVGKSFFTMMMAARVSSGIPFPSSSAPRPVERGQVLILQTEDGMEDTCKKRLRWEGADQSMIHFITGTRDRQGKSRPVDLSTDVEQVRRRMRELGNVKLIIVDPLSAYIGSSTKMDSHQDREVRLALRPLMTFIEQEKVAVVGIMHLNKNQMADVIFRISGSAAWAQVPRVIWMISQDRNDPELRWLLAMKNNTIRETEKREAEFGFRIQENHIVIARDEQPIARVC